MRILIQSIVCVALAFPVITVTGCKTDEPGVKSSYRSQWTTVSGNTMKATEAAKDVLQELKLQNVDAKSTALDGYATGFTADNKKIAVDIKKLTDTTSEVSVNVGSMGDPEMGKDIIARIHKELAG